MSSPAAIPDADSGWVKVHRKLLKSAIWGNEGLVAVWIWCLLRANRLETWQTMSIGRGKTQVHLLPGQFVTGRDSGGKELHQKPTTFRKRMLVLQKLGNILVKSDTHWTLVTVCNWDRYQNTRKPKGQASDRQVTGKGQASDTDKKYKNEKKKKNTALALGAPPVENGSGNGERRMITAPEVDLASTWDDLLKLDRLARTDEKEDGDFQALMTVAEDVLAGKLGSPDSAVNSLTTLAHQIGSRAPAPSSPLGMFLAEVGKMRIAAIRRTNREVQAGNQV